jgi:hypothetical protein
VAVTNSITRSFDNSCSSRNEQHGGGPKPANHKSYSNSTQKVPGRKPGTALNHRADSPPLAICPPYPFPFFH